MNTFLYAIIAMLSTEILAKIICLAIGRFPQRTPMAVAIDVIIGIGVLVWAVTLLVRG